MSIKKKFAITNITKLYNKLKDVTEIYFSKNEKKNV